MMTYPYNYDLIPGFGPAHDFAGLYEKFVDMAPPGATLVEIGCYQGRSLCQLGMYAKHSGNDLRIVGVDHMTGQSGGMTGALHDNLKKCGLSDYVEFLPMRSIEAARQFKDDSVFMAFIDANHEFRPVAEDVKAWMPKISPDGWLAGHDARWYTVWWMVNELIPGVIHDPTWMECWFARKTMLRTGGFLDSKSDRELSDMMRSPEWMKAVPKTQFGEGEKRNDGRKAGIINEI